MNGKDFEKRYPLLVPNARKIGKDSMKTIFKKGK